MPLEQPPESDETEAANWVADYSRGAVFGVIIAAALQKEGAGVPLDIVAASIGTLIFNHLLNR